MKFDKMHSKVVYRYYRNHPDILAAVSKPATD